MQNSVVPLMNRHCGKKRTAMSKQAFCCYFKTAAVRCEESPQTLLCLGNVGDAAAERSERLEDQV